MTILSNYEYYRADSVKEAVKLLSQTKGVILAGGTDLCNMLKDGTSVPKAVIDIKGIPELYEVQLKENKLYVGANVTFTELMENETVCTWFPILAEMASTVASGATRNRATMIGNICSAVPCADSGAPLMAYDTNVIIQGPKGTRSVSILKFFKGPRKTVLKKDEMVTMLEIVTPDTDHAGCYLKHQRYAGEDLAQSSIAILAYKDGSFKIGYGSVAATPLRGTALEKFLKGKTITNEIIEEAKEVLDSEIFPISDVRSTADFRRHMMKVMFERGIKASLERLEGNGPEYFERLV